MLQWRRPDLEDASRGWGGLHPAAAFTLETCFSFSVEELD